MTKQDLKAFKKAVAGLVGVVKVTHIKSIRPFDGRAFYYVRARLASPGCISSKEVFDFTSMYVRLYPCVEVRGDLIKKGWWARVDGEEHLAIAINFRIDPR